MPTSSSSKRHAQQQGNQEEQAFTKVGLPRNRRVFLPARSEPPATAWVRIPLSVYFGDDSWDHMVDENANAIAAPMK